MKIRCIKCGNVRYTDQPSPTKDEIGAAMCWNCREVTICKVYAEGGEVMCGLNLKEANRKADVDKLVESLKDGRNIKSPDTPKPRRATNRELSMWLAQGNGECLGSHDDADTAWNYPQKCSDTEVREGAKVRKWSDTEWHEPTVDYLFGGDDADR